MGETDFSTAGSCSEDLMAIEVIFQVTFKTAANCDLNNHRFDKMWETVLVLTLNLARLCETNYLTFTSLALCPQGVFIVFLQF